MGQLAEIIRILPGYDPYAQAVDCEFREKTAKLVIDFVEECCTHVKGELAGKPLLLEDWQKAVFANLFGWYRPDGTRRYREVLVYIPRGNGKTLMAASLVCVALFLDYSRGTAGAEIYSSAATEQQSRLCFDSVAQMIRNEPEFSSRAEIFKTSVVASDRSYKPLTATPKSKHGMNIQCLVNDELHAHQTPEITEVLMTGMGKRPQPICFHLTTADYEREGSICNQKHDYGCKVRDNPGDPGQPGYDPSFLPVIYEAKLEDDWTDEEIWRKANPNFDISIPRDYIERECRRAQAEPAYENTFKRLHLDIRTQQSSRLFAIESWDACIGELPDLTHWECWCGLDLGSTSDLTAFVAVFKLGGERYGIKSLFWCPRDTAENRSRQDNVPYVRWIDSGLMLATDGDEVHYDRVRADIVAFGEQHAIQEIAADRLFQGAQLLQQLREQDGFEAYAHGQGFVSMAWPVKNFLELLNDRRIVHDGNPVLRWMAGNVAGKQDEAGNWKPDKKRSAEKIDGIVALIMGLGRACACEEASIGIQ